VDTAGLKIQITADVNDATSQLSGMQDNLSKLEGALKNAVNPELINIYTGKVKELRANMAELGQTVTSGAAPALEKMNQGLVHVGSATQQTRYAMQDLSHLFRDLPYAISNPAILVGPFDRMSQALIQLKQETGSTKGAFGALAASFTGGGGLLIGISAAVTLFSLFGSKIVDIIKGTHELSQNQKNLNDVVADANKSAGEQIETLKILYTAATNVNLSMAARLDAVHKLKTEFPEYFGQISNETILNGKAKQSYDDLTASIIKSSRAKAAKDKLDDIERQMLDVDFQKEKIRNATAAEAARVKGPQSASSTRSGFVYGGSGVTEASTVAGQLSIIEARKNAALGIQDKITKNLQDQADFLTKFVGVENLAKGIEVKEPKTGKLNNSDLNAALSLQQSLLEENAKIGKSAREADLLDARQKFDENVRILKAGHLSDEQEVINFREKVRQINEKYDEIEREEHNKFVNEQYIPDIKTRPLTGGALANKSADAIKLKRDSDRIAEQQQKIREQLQETADMVNGTLSPAFDAFFNAITTGSGDAFGAFISALGQTIIELEKLLIKEFLFYVIKQAISGGTGASIGDFFSSGAFTAIPHAEGGIFTGPTLLGNHLFGEAGPEAIVPLNRMNEFNGGSRGQQVFIPNLKVQGSDLLIAFDRATARRGRNG